MFLGHYGLAMAAKKAAPGTSLGSFIVAAQLADMLWPIFLLLGLEKVNLVPQNPVNLQFSFVRFPITHSLLTEILGGLLLGTAYWLICKSSPGAQGSLKQGALVLALLVPSHWMLDFLVHIPDLPIWPGGPKVGLGLWQSIPWTIALETIFFFGGLAIYVRTTKARDRIGSYALWAMVILLVLVYASVFTDTPSTDPADAPSWRPVAYSALALWLFVPWGYWIDRHRVPRG